MNWWDRLLLALSPTLREAVSPPGGAIDPDDALYRRLTGRSVSDLPAYQHERMLDVALYLDRHNLLARRLLWIITDFVVAEGVSYHAHNSQVDEWLRRHWHDEDNNWSQRAPRLFRTLLRDGEILLTAGVNPVDGFVLWGAIPARRIKDVRPHPDNWERTEQVVLYPDRPGAPDRVLEVIRRPLGETRLQGQVLYERINDDGLRGISELFASADFLDALDSLVFSDVERQQLLKAFVWDVTVAGADDARIHQLLKDPSFQPPKPGSVRVHNEQVEWKAVAPDMRAFESVASLRFLRNFIAGGHGVPEHWLGEGGDVNRAVGAVMDTPSLKTFTRLQARAAAVLMRALRFVIDQAVLHGSLPPLVPREDADGNPTGELIDPRDAFELVTPDMDPTDQGQLAAAFGQITHALLAADGKYISEETGRKLLALVLAQFGVEVDPQAEAEAITAQREQDDRRWEARSTLTPEQRAALERAMAAPEPEAS